MYGNSTTITLAVIASMIQIWGHVRYNQKSGIHPNVTSWTIWAFTSIIDTFNYSEMTADWQKNILSITCSVSCFITWVVCLYKGKFEKPTWKEYTSFFVCIAALVIWKRFGLVKETNVVLQVDNLISFIPIIAGVATHPKDEDFEPWLWWTLSYSIGTVVVLLRYTQWQDLLYPAGCAILHLIVSMLSLRKSNTTRPLPV